MCLPPMGLRMRLKADFKITGFPKPVAVLLTAMKKYGIILADNGSAVFLTGAKDARWDRAIFRPIMQVTANDLEAVETGNIQK